MDSFPGGYRSSSCSPIRISWFMSGFYLPLIFQHDLLLSHPTSCTKSRQKDWLDLQYVFFLGEKQNRCGDFKESKKTQQHMDFASGLFWNFRREKCYPTENETTTKKSSYRCFRYIN